MSGRQDQVQGGMRLESISREAREEGGGKKGRRCSATYFFKAVSGSRQTGQQAGSGGASHFYPSREGGRVERKEGRIDS